VSYQIWYLSIYFRPKNKLLPELIKKDGTRTPLMDIGKIEMLMLMIKESFLRNEDRPVLIFNGTHSIEHLDKLFITPRHKKLLQEEECAFYFFEPLTHYICREGRDPNLEPHILRCNNDPYEIANVRCLELDSLQAWVEKYNIKNLHVYCTDYKSCEYYKDLYPNLVLKEMDFFVSWYCTRYMAQIIRGDSLGHLEKEYMKPENITKKFWSGAWRYDPSRHFITAYLAGKDLIKENNVSFYFKLPNSEFKRRMWFGWKEFSLKFPRMAEILLEGNTKLQELVPLSIEIDNPAALEERAQDPEADSDGKNTRKNHDPVNSYLESFCAIVQETRVTQPWANISEKTLNAMKNYRPFVIAGAPGTIKMLKDMGFKTFDRWWDESYDDVVGNKERLVKLCETIDYINNFSIEEMREIYKEMTPILKHNVENFAKIEDWYNNRNI
jgi:hypothetical protein